MYNYYNLWEHDVSDDIIKGNLDNLQAELDKGWNLNEPIAKYVMQGILKFPIMLAIQMNNMILVKCFFEHGAILDIDNEHAFIYALEYADEIMIKYVVSKGAKVNVYNNVLNAFDYIVDRNRLEYIQLVEELGLSVQPYGEHALFSAIYRNNYDAIQAFINHGIDLNYNKKMEWNSMGNTSLGHAASYCDEEMIQFLIGHGADPTIPNKSGKRPYTLALCESKINNAKLLRKYETTIDKPDDKILKKLPKELLDFLKKENLKVYLTKEVGIEYIEFLPFTDLVTVNFDGRKGVLITREIENYSDICLIWNPKKKCVSYYEEEHGWYGDFGVSFQVFIEQPERYVKGIFTEEFLNN